MAIQLLGQDGASVLGIDPSFKAGRVSLRPIEMRGWFSLGAVSGLATGIAANGVVFAFRNLSANPIMIRRAGIGFITTTAFTTAQKIDYGLYFARPYTGPETNQTVILLTGNNAKVRTEHQNLTSVECRISATGAITGGTRTLDANALGIVAGWSAGQGVTISPQQDNLFSQNAGDHPIILAQNEGIVITNLTAMGAAGVGNIYVILELAELLSF